MENNNLKFWDTVKKTDPQHTRKVNQRGGYTAIDPQYQLREATKQWGMYGSTWGLKDITYDYSLIESTRLAVVKSIFFYPNGQFEITNAIEVISTKGYTDADFAKKVETNTLSKALSKLGFSADVFMGEFDDVDYVNQIANEKAIENAINKEEEAEKKRAEYVERMSGHVKLMEESKTITELNSLYKKAFRVAGFANDEKGQLRLTQVRDEKLEKLKESYNG